MRILQINNFHYLRGGSERYYFDVSNLLKTKGHEVIHFSMYHSENRPSDYSQYFVSHIDFAEIAQNINLRNGLRVIMRTIYSYETKKKLTSLIKTEKPDVVHLQNFHSQLSPSVLYSAKENGLPVVWTVHDYEPLCPNTLFLNSKGVCEDCTGGKYYKVIANRCKKESLAASVMAAITFYAHRTANIYKMIDYFITPSEFLKNKLIDYGFDSNKIVHIPNFIDIEKTRPSYTHAEYFLYLGRLSKEKGILTLLKALKSLQGNARLKIVGKGQLEEEIVEYITNNKLENFVEMLGYRGGKELEDIIKKAMFVVVPSEWYENFPYAVLEAFAYGKPVIGACIGGIPEQIDDGVNGYLFEYKNASELAEKIISLIDNPEHLVEMGKKAREKAELKYNSQHHYETLMNLYRRLV